MLAPKAGRKRDSGGKDAGEMVWDASSFSGGVRWAAARPLGRAGSPSVCAGWPARGCLCSGSTVAWVVGSRE